MKKIVIAFTVDHVFRNIYGKIVDLYKKYYIDEPTYDATENGEEFTAPELKLPINTNDLMNHIPFKCPDDMEDFIFSEFPLEIFGYSKESESGSIQMFNYWYQNLPENIDVILTSNEIGRTKPSTLFFLSKTGFEGNNIKFIGDNIDIWSLCDILVTSSEVKTVKPKNKKLIIIEREHNKQLNGDMKYNNLFDFYNDDISNIINGVSQNNNILKQLKKCLKIGMK
jgi:hypothetical protein